MTIFLLVLVLAYLAWGVWLHAQVKHEDLWRPGLSATGFVGDLMESLGVFYVFFLVAWPVWWFLHRRNRRGEVIVRAPAKVPSAPPLPTPTDFSDPAVADAVRAMREALEASGGRR